jgi:RNA polymerase sigma-70 factor (ECF subfamily)
VTRTDGDAELLAAIARGDRSAFEVFYRRHAAWLQLRLRYRCADRTVVDDVVTPPATWPAGCGGSAPGA